MCQEEVNACEDLSHLLQFAMVLQFSFSCLSLVHVCHLRVSRSLRTRLHAQRPWGSANRPRTPNLTARAEGSLDARLGLIGSARKGAPPAAEATGGPKEEIKRNAKCAKSKEH